MIIALLAFDLLVPVRVINLIVINYSRSLALIPRYLSVRLTFLFPDDCRSLYGNEKQADRE